jgi:His/Glu/Gln/Arg/opine family amino acid ABC transporter permease subunit
MVSFEQWPEWMGQLLSGLWTSIQLTTAMLAVGLPLGLVLALMLSTDRWLVRALAVAIIETGRSVPVLVLLYLVYFGLPEVDVRPGAFAAATAALGFSFGAYTSEVFRAGIAAVPTGQREASQAIGLTRSQDSNPSSARMGRHLFPGDVAGLRGGTTRTSQPGVHDRFQHISVPERSYPCRLALCHRLDPSVARH